MSIKECLKEKRKGEERRCNVIPRVRGSNTAGTKLSAETGDEVSKKWRKNTQQ